MFFQHADATDIGSFTIREKFGQSLAYQKMFETPYLPQMWGDSPHLKNVFIRVPRGVIITNRMGGTVPPRGQTPKVPRPQKSLNAIYLSYVFGIFFKICDIDEHHPFWQ